MSAWWGRPVAETRAWLELARLPADPVFRGRSVPRGDDRPVVLVPGFLAGDQTLAVLAAWLRVVGYAPHVCGFISNADCSDRAFERVARKAEALQDGSGRRVAIVGHSRGGHIAKALGAARPDLVSHAISMGADLQDQLGISTPTLLAVGATRCTLLATRRAREPGCLTADCSCTFTHSFYDRFPTGRVRLTSIYTKGDGVVRWQRCIVPDADCVEVTGSHVGLVVNRAAYRAIALALAAPEL